MKLNAEVSELKAKEEENVNLEATVEELVREYSHLAAQNHRSEDLASENELLRDKVLALEHSVNQLAESALLKVDDEEKGTTGSSDAKSLRLEVKQLRAELVNLQFDNRSMSKALLDRTNKKEDVSGDADGLKDHGGIQRRLDILMSIWSEEGISDNGENSEWRADKRCLDQLVASLLENSRQRALKAVGRRPEEHDEEEIVQQSAKQEQDDEEEEDVDGVEEEEEEEEEEEQ